MELMQEGFLQAIKLILTLDGETFTVVLRSLQISFFSTLITTILALPFVLLLIFKDFWGKRMLLGFLQTAISIPTVIIGLLVFSLLSRSGPFGSFSLLYTWQAIVVGQILLILPLLSILIYNVLQGFQDEVKKTTLSLGATSLQGGLMLLLEGRYAVLGAVITGFGRVIGEIGISMMLGGNIQGATRTITTTIALETGRGDFALGMALGIILLVTSFFINLLLQFVQGQ